MASEQRAASAAQWWSGQRRMQQKLDGGKYGNFFRAIIPLPRDVASAAGSGLDSGRPPPITTSIDSQFGPNAAQCDEMMMLRLLRRTTPNPLLRAATRAYTMPPAPEFDDGVEPAAKRARLGPAATPALELAYLGPEGTYGEQVGPRRRRRNQAFTDSRLRDGSHTA